MGLSYFISYFLLNKFLKIKYRPRIFCKFTFRNKYNDVSQTLFKGEIYFKSDQSENHRIFNMMCMIFKKSIFILSCVFCAVLLSSTSTWANPQVQKPIKRLIKAIQYEKDAIALKSFNGHLQGEFLIGPMWEKTSTEHRQAFIKRLHQFFTLMAFPKLRKDLKHLETIVYKKPVIQGKKAKIEAVIVVLHALKKQEIPVSFELYKTKKTWQIVEFKIGDSNPFLAQLKTGQIQPLLKKKGWTGLLDAMQTRIDQLTQK